MSQQYADIRDAQLAAFAAKVAAFAETLTPDEQEWLGSLLSVAAANSEEVGGYLFKPFFTAPAGVGSPTVAGQPHLGFGTSPASEVNGSQNPTPELTNAQLAALVIQGISSAFSGL